MPNQINFIILVLFGAILAAGALNAVMQLWQLVNTP
jgi:hypothetical protein